MPKLRQEIVDGSIGYVAPYVLVEGKVKEIQQAVRDLEKKGANRFVLDLRNVALGDTSQGIPLADLFMSKGKITHTEGQRSPKEEFTATAQPGDLSQPLVVLVNRGTAGAAEVAAAALKASGRAKVVGERSYGFAGIRREIQMDDGGAVLISGAKYYAPDGKAIPDNGEDPDEAVSPYPQLAASEEEGELAEPPALGPDDPLKPVEDLQLKKALEVIAGSGAAAKAA